MVFVGLGNCCIATCKCCTQALILINVGQKEEVDENPDYLPETLEFYYLHSGFIEFFRDKVVHRLCYPLQSYCFAMPEDEKIIFIDEADRSNISSKVAC